MTPATLLEIVTPATSIELAECKIERYRVQRIIQGRTETVRRSSLIAALLEITDCRLMIPCTTPERPASVFVEIGRA